MFSVLRVPRYELKNNIKIDTVNSKFYQTQAQVCILHVRCSDFPHQYHSMQ